MEIHSEQRPYKCNQCNKCFKQASVLYHYLRVHRDPTSVANVTSALNNQQAYTITSDYIVMKGPTSVHSVKNVSENHHT